VDAKRIQKEDGFTLIEVLAALAIFSVSILGLISSIGHATRTATDIELRTLAGIVAENRIAVFRSECGGTVGTVNDAIQRGRCAQSTERRGEENILNQIFSYTITAADTPDERIRELIVAVSAGDQKILSRRSYYRTPRISAPQATP